MGEVAGSPVHRGAHGAHERRHQRDHHQAERHRGQQLHGQGGIAELKISASRQQHQGRQRDHDPEPAAHEVIHHQKHPTRQPRLLLIAGGQHALDELATPIAAAETPPLHSDVGREHRDADAAALQPVEARFIPGPGHQRQQLRPLQRLQLFQQRCHPSCGMEGSRGHSKGTRQRQHKLDEIGDHDGPESTGHGVTHHKQSHHHQEPDRVRQSQCCGLTRHQPQRFHHLAEGEEGIADADAVHRHGQQESLDAAQPSRRRSAIAQLGEGGVGEHTAAAPEGCEDNSHGHVGQTKAPPLPVARQAAGTHQAGDVKRRIDGEGGGRHRGAGQPAVQTTASHEIIRLAAVAAGQPQPQHQGENEVSSEKQPIDRCHAQTLFLSSLLRNRASAHPSAAG